MGKIQQVGDLELDQDFSYQQQLWVVQRVGWFVMAAIVLAGASGLFGGGWLSQAQVGSASDPLWIEYERFGRLQAPTQMKIYVAPQSQPAQEVRLLLDRDYTQKVQIQEILPTPTAIAARSNQWIYSFKTLGTEEPLSIQIVLRPEAIGAVKGTVALDQGRALHFNQFIYP